MGSFFILKGFASKEDIHNAYYNNIPSHNIEVYKNEDLFLESLITSIQREEYPIRHESVLEEQPTFSFFIDFDISEKCNDEESRSDVSAQVYNISIEIAKVLYETFDWRESQSEEDDLISFDYFIQKYKETMRVAVSNEQNTTRFHFFFKNIRISTQYVTNLRKAILAFKKSEKILKSSIKTSIDHTIYKKSFNLRYIYSKSHKKESFYVPKVIEDDAITRDDEELTTDNLHYYSINSEPKTPFLIIDRIKNMGEELNYDEVLYTPMIEPEKSPYISTLIMSDIIQTIFGLEYIVMQDYSNHFIILTSDIDLNTPIYDIVVKRNLAHIEFTFDYDTAPCYFCGKSVHKNIFHLTFARIGIIIKKAFGNSCRKKKRTRKIKEEGEISEQDVEEGSQIKVYSYPKLTISHIINYLIMRDECVLVIKNNKIALFASDQGWDINNPEYYLQRIIRVFLLFPYIHMKDKISLLSTSMKRITEALEEAKLSSKIKRVHNETHMAKCQNGIIDIRRKIVIPIAESKEYYVFNKTIDTPYKQIGEYNEEEHLAMKEYLEVINSSQPEVFSDGRKNPDKPRLDRGRGSILVSTEKDFIIVYQGPTKAGKSSLLRIDRMMLGFGNWAKTGKSTIRRDVSADNGNPSLAQIENKFLYQITEIDKNITSSAIKGMTEDVITARNLYDSNPLKSSTATIICDTNAETFAFIDTASASRILLISFNITHTDIPTHAKFIDPADKSLPHKISSKRFNIPCLTHLVDLANKYHTPTISMILTPEKFPSVQYTTLLKRHFISSWSFNKHLENKQEYIINKEAYRISTFHQRNMKILHFTLIKERFIGRITEIISFFQQDHLIPHLNDLMQETNCSFVYVNDLTEEAKDILKTKSQDPTIKDIFVDFESCASLVESNDNNKIVKRKTKNKIASKSP